MTTLTHIPLNQLESWDGNVRKAPGSDTALAELAASIAAHGLLQSLVVRKTRKNRFAVIAGGRRLQALHALAERGAIAGDHPVACQVLAAQANATEASLAENAVREAMHPADEFEAFRRLADEGLPVADIGARFGVTDSVVEKRLRLGRVSPKILKAYRDDEITLECVMAFAVTDDVKAQDALWKSLPSYRRHASIIRRALTENDIPASDRRVRFVTLAAYRKAGGITREDLFTEGHDGVFVLNAPLLEELATAKLERAAVKIRKEGWSWVETHPDFSYEDRATFRQLHPEPVPLSGEVQDEQERLQAELDAFFSGAEESTPEEDERIDAIRAQLDEIASEQEHAWPDQVFGLAGAVIGIGSDGKADITRGLVRPEDAKKWKALSTGESSPETSPLLASKPAMPAKLLERLTAHRSAALSAELLDRPPVALAAVVHALALPLFTGESRSTATCLRLSLTEHSQRRVEGSLAYERIAQERERWSERLPETSESLWGWCLEQHRDVLVELLAYCAAVSIDAVARKRGAMDLGTSLAQADDLAMELGLDMTKWFTATAESYFAHVAKPLILEALQETKGSVAPAWSKAKKSELAAIAEREIAGRNWLPQILRAPDEPGEELSEAA